MEQLLNFMDMGFILTLGILILVSGAIMLYCYRRLNLLENSIIEHGKILQNFIINYNNQMIIESSQNNMNFFSNKNVENVDQNNELKKIDLENKINISDNEDEESDNEDEESDDEDEESDDEDEDSDDEDEESNNIDDEKSYNRESLDNIKNNNVDSDNNEQLFVEKEEIIKSIKIEELSDDNNIFLNEDLINKENNDTVLTDLPIDLNNLELADNSKIINLESNDDNNDEKKNYNKMKVDDLRSLVVSKSLTDNDSSKNMKKSDLIKLLQNEN